MNRKLHRTVVWREKYMKDTLKGMRYSRFRNPENEPRGSERKMRKRGYLRAFEKWRMPKGWQFIKERVENG